MQLGKGFLSNRPSLIKSVLLLILQTYPNLRYVYSVNLGVISLVGVWGKLEAPSAAGSTQVKPKAVAKPKPGFLERRSSDTVVTLSPWKVRELAYLKPASCEPFFSWVRFPGQAQMLVGQKG